MLDKPTADPLPDGAARPRARAPTRRQFLVGTGAVAGLMVGFALWPRQWPNARRVADDDVLLNAWISIAPDGQVTVAVPQAEMGQGVFSGLAQIVADELGARWDMVGVEPAPWHPAFAHVGLASAGTAGLPPVVRDVAGYLGATVIQRMNLHMTGGSTSIRGYHDGLRDAAATARTLMTDAVAREWGASRDAVTTAGGMVLFKANRMTFADAVRLVDPARARGRVTLRAAETRALAGKPVPRIDIPAKTDGSARFGGDVRLPGMVFAAIRQGPIGGTLRAATAPGQVRLVKGANWVATTGTTWFEAERALGTVNADFAVPADAALVAGPWIADAVVAAVGAPGDAPAGATGQVRADYRVPFLAHACMEPMVAVARVADGRAEIWGPTQSLTLAHMAVADALGIETSAVTIHPTLLGGGFGRKVEGDAMAQAALIARAVGSPVLLQWSRAEDFAGDRFRPPAAAAMEATLSADGTIADWRARVAAPNVGASFMARTLPSLAGDPEKPADSAIEGMATIPYATDRFEAVHVPVVQPVPLGYWRSVGHSFTAFFVESFVDELAAEAGRDPLAFRLALLADKPRHARVLRAAAAIGLWDQPPAGGFGRGVALHESFGSIVATVIEAGVVDGAVRIRRLASAIDCGRAINPDTVRAQLEGGAIMGLSAAMGEAVGFEGGRATARNFDRYPILPMRLSPDAVVSTIIPPDDAMPLGGVGEPGTPPAAPALANALYAATGRRARQLPLGNFYAG